VTRARLTKTFVDDAQPGAGNVYIWDEDVRGFGLKITKTGSKVYVLSYRMGGRDTTARRLTIGKPGSPWTPHTAREQAKDWLALARKGIDPADEKRRMVEQFVQPAARDHDTPPPELAREVQWVCVRFIERHARPNQRSWRDTDRLLAKHVIPKWMDRPIKSITRADVHELLDSLIDAGMAAGANRVRSWISKLFNWAISRDLVDMNPVVGVAPPAKENRGERELADAEIVILWWAANELAYPFGSFCKVALLTGQRRDEVARMRWDQVDLKGGEEIWTIPSPSTKADRSHVVPLAPLVVKILRSLPKLGPFVFSTLGDRPISGYSKFKMRFDDIAEAISDEHQLARLDPWTLHDLRRTATTGWSKLGITPHIKDWLLNHADRSVTGQHYDRYQYLAEKRNALIAWARRVQKIVDTNNAAQNVFALGA
jgi:integrase